MKEYTITFTVKATKVLKDIPDDATPSSKEEMEKIFADQIKYAAQLDDVVVSNVKIFEMEAQ